MTQSQQAHDTEIIIRFSHAWWVYMFARGGILRAMVNGLEDTLAITGRTLLLIFLLYCGVKSGALLVKPDWSAPLWLEMGMFVLQLAGLEGSIPGLARHADRLRNEDDDESATKVDRVMMSARVMTILTIGEGVLHLFGLDSQILRVISGILLLVRGIVITSFLVELAKIEAKSPRVLSRDEHAREEQARLVEGEQARTIAGLRAQLEEALTSLATAQQQARQRENEQTQTITQLRDQIAQVEATNASLLNGAEGQGTVIRNLQNQLAHAQQQVQDLMASFEQKRRDFEKVSTDLQTAHLHIADLQFAESETAKMRQEYQDLSANLQTAYLQIADLTAKLERAKNKIADLQTTAGGDAAPSVPPRSTKAATQQTDQSKITSIDQARAKHDVGSQGRAKVSHADVMAFMAANPTLKRAEVAEQLGISERKVYDAIAWQRDQEKEQGDAASAR